MTRIHQVLSGAGPVDAVTTQAFEYHRAFESWGMAGGIHAAAIEPALRTHVEPLAKLEAAADDLLLFHYSAYAPRLEPMLVWPQPKLLVYHNVTPAEWLWEHQPHVATLCALGRDHLPRWAQAVDVAAAVSGYNAEELRAAGARDVRVVPILFDPVRLADGQGGANGGTGARILSVGRLAPHKRPDLVIRAFELHRAANDPHARLDLVGEPLSPAYAETIRALAGPGVHIHGRLEQGDLNRLWHQADAFVTLSEHEGFCVPLLEAFATDTPVIARPVGGMPEVGGDAVLWVEDRDLAVVAEVINAVTQKGGIRSQQISAGRVQLEKFSREATLAKLRDAVDAALA